MSKRNTVPPSSTSGFRDDGYAGGTRALSETSLDCWGALGTEPCTSVSVGKGHATNSNTGSRQRRHNRARSTATIVGVPQSERRSSQWDAPLATWSSRPSDSAELRCILPEVRELVGTTRRKIVTDAEIDAAMSTWMENEFMKRNLASSEERLLSAWMDKYPSFGRHGARKLPIT